MTPSPEASLKNLPVIPTASTTDERGGGFAWDVLVSLVLHPIQVAWIEALQWLDVPVAPIDLVQMFEGSPYTVSLVGYHAKRLLDVGVLDLAATEPVRGTVKHYYALVAGLRCR